MSGRWRWDVSSRTTQGSAVALGNPQIAHALDKERQDTLRQLDDAKFSSVSIITLHRLVIELWACHQVVSRQSQLCHWRRIFYRCVS